MQKHLPNEKALLAKSENVKSRKPVAKPVRKAAPARKDEPARHARDLRSALDWLKAQGDLIETDREVDPNLECGRTLARRIQATDQDADRPAISRNRCDVILGSASFRADHHAQSRRLAKPQRTAFRSDH